jgi:putative ABC transport system permease protein
MGKLFRRIYYLLHRERLERELSNEMDAHREMMPEDRRNLFGNSWRLQDEIRDSWGGLWLDHLRQDCSYAVRGFLRERRFTLSALVAISLAVGAATAVFSVADRSLFRALPYHEGNRLVSVGMVMPTFGNGEFMFLGAHRDWQTSQTALDLTSWSGVGACDLGGDSPQRVGCARAESTFLPTLGVQPILGRNFSAGEDRQEAEPVALLSYGMWQTGFGADPSALGKHVVVDGVSTRIVGVLPASFETPDLSPAELLLPSKLPQAKGRNIMVTMLGRLRPGNTVESAAVALAHPFELFRADFGSRVAGGFEKAMRLHIETLRDQQIRQYQLALWMLLGSVAAFVLIACANVANLLLARSTTRRQEFAIRAALGASRQRLFSQMLTESAVLGLAGGTAGCGLAWCLLRACIALAPDGTLRLGQASLDGRVLGFALVLSLGTALLFGLAPSLDRLHGESLSAARTTGHGRRWLREAVITSQLAVSLILLAAAGLLLASLSRLQNVPLGFQPERIVTASFTLPVYRYADDARQMNFFNQLEARLNELPAVAVAITDSVPPGAGPRTSPYVNFAQPGADITDPGMSGSVKWRYVTPGYFAALGIPIRRGRSFSDADRQPGVRDVVVNESLARRVFGDADPIGQLAGAKRVVGVAANVHNAGLDQAADPEFYIVRKATRDGVPGSGDPAWTRRGTAVLRSTLSERDAAELLRESIQQIDRTVPVKVESMESQVDRFLTRPRFQTALLTMFASTGLALAAIGLYGLISFLVAERTREIGVRMALGATPRNIARMVVADGMRWAAAGVAIGIAASAACLRLLRGMLFEVQVFDPRIFGVAATVLVAVVILAAWLPARRASQTDPMIALRHE